MKKILTIFWHTGDAKPWLVLACLVCASLFEIVGVGTLLPLFALGEGQVHEQTSAFAKVSADVMSALGLGQSTTQLIMFMMAMLLMKNLMSFVALSYAGFVQMDVTAALRRKLLRAIFDANWSFLVSRRSGEITHIINNEAGKVGGAFMLSAWFMSHVVNSLIYITAGLLISFNLVLLTVSVFIILAVALRPFISKSREIGTLSTKTSARFMSEMSDYLANLKPIKAMGREAAYSAVLEGRNEQLKSYSRTLLLLNRGRERFSECLLVILLVGGLFLAQQYLSLGTAEIIVFGVIILKGGGTAKELQSHLQAAAELEESFSIGRKSEENWTAADDTYGGANPPILAREIKFQNVSFNYGERSVLENITFSIPKTGITLLIGPSGVGKTTLSDLLIGLLEPSEGQIFLDDQPYSSVDMNAWRDLIGYVPQELRLLNGTLRNAVAFGRNDIGDAEITAALEKSGLSSFLPQLEHGLETEVGEFGAKLSGGERQRIALARALAGSPRLLVLDEATSALDTQTESEICEMVSRLSEHHAIFVVAHRPAWRRVAAKIYEIGEGKLSAVSADTPVTGMGARGKIVDDELSQTAG